MVSISFREKDNIKTLHYDGGFTFRWWRAPAVRSSGEGGRQGPPQLSSKISATIAAATIAAATKVAATVTELGAGSRHEARLDEETSFLEGLTPPRPPPPLDSWAVLVPSLSRPSAPHDPQQQQQQQRQREAVAVVLECLLQAQQQQQQQQQGLAQR
ncbi:hypothetical protein Esti_001041 [Eimeria stiedai]